MINKNAEFLKWCDILVEKADEEIKQCYLTANNIFKRALEGKITIVDKKFV